MDLDRLFAYLVSLRGVVEERPFTPEIPVFKVMGKMFAYVSPNVSPPLLTIKLEPLHGQLLRSTYAAVMPGYHMNKDHWNSVSLDGSVSEDELLSWIDESYDLVVENLPHQARKKLAEEQKKS